MTTPFRDDLSRTEFTHGGARPGSGRKPKADKREVFSCRVTPFTAMQIRIIAARKGVGLGEAIDELVQSYIKS